jgi:hypothetical protein
MMDLDSIEIEKATKKIRGGEGQSPFDKVLKQYDFICIFFVKKVGEKTGTIEQHPTLEEDPRQQGSRGHFGNTYCRSSRWS